MTVQIPATINRTRKKGNSYRTGHEPVEIWVKRDRAAGLPFVLGRHVPITLAIEDARYNAKLCSTPRNKVVLISPKIYSLAGQRTTLAAALAEHGFLKTDKILLEVDGTVVTVRNAHPNMDLPIVRWAAHPSLPEEIVAENALTEGPAVSIQVNAYERNPVARSRCIAHYARTCAACKFDFGLVYGPLAEGFIHVHHVRPLAEIGEEYEVDPISDLRPVCPNCHAVIHLNGECRGIDEVKQLLASRQKSNHMA